MTPAHLDENGPLFALVPAYQCATTIGDVVEGIQRQGMAVLVVDDGSSDDTAAAAQAAGAQVLRHPRNQGKGAALVTGFGWALDRGASAVLTLDGDRQHAPDEIPRLTALAGRADLVIGRRRLEPPHMPAGRVVGNRISTFFIGLFCGSRMHDTQCGFRLYSRRLLTSLPLRPGRFETETELLMRAQLLGLTVRWVPIATIYGSADGTTDGPSTHFDNFSDTLRVIRVVLASPWYPRARPGRR